MAKERKLTGKEIKEIETLVNRAMTVGSKKLACPYINRLEFMQRTLNIMPSGNYILAELVAYIKAGAGQVNEKEHWINAVNQSMNKLRDFCEEDEFEQD